MDRSNRTLDKRAVIYLREDSFEEEDEREQQQQANKHRHDVVKEQDVEKSHILKSTMSGLDTISYERRHLVWGLVWGILLVLFTVVFILMRSVHGSNKQDGPVSSAGVDALQCEIEDTWNMTWAEYEQFVAVQPLDKLCAAHWTEPCECLRPLKPVSKRTILWQETAKRNLELVEDAKDEEPLDVVMLGDSITEHWLSTEMGVYRQEYERINTVYKRLFQRRYGASVEGLPLGIANDRCPHLLYRLQNGELAAHLQPSVWWILIGTSDFGGEHCHENVITAGNIRIVEEILAARPDAVVVLNSILPRGMGNLLNSWGWNLLSRVNQRLECYAAGKERVEFFNATSYFLASDGQSLNMSLMMDGVHPGSEGYLIWGQAMVEKVTEIQSRD